MTNARHRSAEILSLLYILGIVKRQKRMICCPVGNCSYTLSYPPRDWNNAWKLMRNHIARMHGMTAKDLSWRVLEELRHEVERIEVGMGERVFYSFRVDPEFRRTVEECPPCVDVVYCTVRVMEGKSIACEREDEVLRLEFQERSMEVDGDERSKRDGDNLTYRTERT